MSNVGIYIVAIIRLLVMPLILFFIEGLINLPSTLYICAAASLAMLLGLNTIVIPSAHGKDTTVAAGMAIISHMLSIITLSIVFALIL